MKKTILVMIIILSVVFYGCSNLKQKNVLNSNPDDTINESNNISYNETNDNSDYIEKSLKLETPFFEGFKAMPIFYFNDNKIILCYIKFGSDKQTKISLFDTETKQFNTIYEGDFYISATDSYFSVTQKGFILQIGPNQLTFDRESVDIKEIMPDIGSKIEFSLYEPSFGFTIEEESNDLYLMDNKDNIRSKLNPPDSRYKTSFKWNPTDTEFIYLADHLNVVIFNKNTEEFNMLKGGEKYPFPDGLVDYLDIFYTGDGENIILHGACEDKTVYQIIDKTNGSLIATYESPHDTKLLGVYEDYLIFVDGDKDSQEIILFDYKNNFIEILFSLEGQYFCGGTVNSNINQIALITLKDDHQYLILYTIKK